MRFLTSKTFRTLFAVSTLAVAAIVQTGQARADDVALADLRANLAASSPEGVDFNGEVQATVRGELQLARGGQAIVAVLTVIYESRGNSYEGSRTYTVWRSDDGRTIARLNGPTHFEWTSDLDAAGAEFGACNPGRAYRINESSSRNGHMLSGTFVRELSIIGDTGGNDVERSRSNFRCNAHLRSIVFNPIPVEFNRGASAFALPAVSAVFCPSRRNLVAYRDGMANGDQDFGRGYTLNGATSFRISGDGAAVEAVMNFRMAEDVPDHTTVEMRDTMVVARAPAGRRIVSFANGATETESFGFDAEDVSGQRRLRLTRAIPDALPTINLTVTGDGNGNDVADSQSQCLRDSGKAKIRLSPMGEFAVVME